MIWCAVYSPEADALVEFEHFPTRTWKSVDKVIRDRYKARKAEGKDKNVVVVASDGRMIATHKPGSRAASCSFRRANQLAGGKVTADRLRRTRFQFVTGVSPLAGWPAGAPRQGENRGA